MKRLCLRIAIIEEDKVVVCIVVGRVEGEVLQGW
jgi:hypothetical protein